MKNILFDLKLSSCFTGTMVYEKWDYLMDEKFIYSMGFKNGKLIDVHIIDEDDPWWFGPEVHYQNWNSEFWRKAPKYANFDNCSWTRKNVFFNLGLATNPFEMDGRPITTIC